MDTKAKYNEVRNKINSNLIYGDIKAIAKAAKRSPEHVRLVLKSEKMFKPRILEKAVKVITDRERKAEAILNQLGC